MTAPCCSFAGTLGLPTSRRLVVLVAGVRVTVEMAVVAARSHTTAEPAQRRLVLIAQAGVHVDDTFGNAITGYTSGKYTPETVRKVSPRALCLHVAVRRQLCRRRQ